MKNLTALTWDWQQECDDILGTLVFVFQQKLDDPNFIVQTDGQTGKRSKCVNVPQLTVKMTKAGYQVMITIKK